MINIGADRNLNGLTLAKAARPRRWPCWRDLCFRFGEFIRDLNKVPWRLRHEPKKKKKNFAAILEIRGNVQGFLGRELSEVSAQIRKRTGTAPTSPHVGGGGAAAASAPNRKIQQRCGCLGHRCNGDNRLRCRRTPCAPWQIHSAAEAYDTPRASPADKLKLSIVSFN